MLWFKKFGVTPVFILIDEFSFVVQKTQFNLQPYGSRDVYGLIPPFLVFIYLLQS